MFLFTLLLIGSTIVSAYQGTPADLISTMKNTDTVVLCEVTAVDEKRVELTVTESIDTKRGKAKKIYTVKRKNLRHAKTFGTSGKYVVVLDGRSKRITWKELKLVFPIVDDHVLLNQVSFSKLKECGFTEEIGGHEEFRIQTLNHELLSPFGYKMELHRFLDLIRLIRKKDADYKTLMEQYEVGSLEYVVCNCLQ